MNKTDYRLIRIACQYGYDAQSRQCIEEMSELTKAINKFWRKHLDCGKKELSSVDFHNKEYEDIVEEIADVQIMLDQMKMFMDCEDSIYDVIEKKIDRQLERISL